MRISIIVPDSTVIIDGLAIKGVDLSELSAEGVHAIQWDGTKGHVERPQGNTRIDSFGPFQRFVNRGLAIKAALEDERARKLADAKASGEVRYNMRRRAVKDRVLDIALALLNNDSAARQRVADAIAQADAEADAMGAS